MAACGESPPPLYEAETRQYGPPVRPHVCRICNNEYAESLHHHLLNFCSTTCPLGCPNTEVYGNIVEHLDDPSKQALHMIELFNMVDSIKSKEACKGAQKSGWIRQSTAATLLDTLSTMEDRSRAARCRLAQGTSNMNYAQARQLKIDAARGNLNRQNLAEMEEQMKQLAQEIHLLTSYDFTVRKISEKVDRQHLTLLDRLSKLADESERDKARNLDIFEDLHHLPNTSYDGKLKWKISNVAAARKNALEVAHHSISSPPFYTSMYGYKFSAQLFLNGDENSWNQFISLYVLPIKGEYDAMLTWPIRRQIRMMLINLTNRAADINLVLDAADELNRPIDPLAGGTGKSNFADLETVFAPGSGFVVDDTMFIEITLESDITSL